MAAAAVSGQKPPNDSACSSRRSSQKGAQPPEDSRNTTRSAGWRSSTPKAISWRAGQHRLEGMGHRVEDQRVEGPVRAERRHRDRTALVHADWDVELLGRPPQGLVGPVGERAAGAGVGPDEAGDEAEIAHGASQLVGRRSRVLQREEGRPEEAARVGGTVGGEPVVVGPSQRHAAGRLLDQREVEADGGIEDGLVDALAVHVGQAGHGVGAAGLRLGQRAEGGRVVEGGARPGQRAQRNGQDLRCADHHVLVAVGVGVDPRPLFVGQAGPGRLGFHHVPVGVDDRAGVRREGRLAHATAVTRQSSRAGSGWRNSAAAFPPATARSSSSGSAPHVSARTRWVSGHEESAWG